MKYKYPLQTDSFNIWDRLKVCAFLLNRKNKLTLGPKTEELEKKWCKFAWGVDAIATSSGSTANILLVESFLQTYNYKPQDVVVFIPATTWASSVSCWTMRGCQVVFVDINLEDFSFNYRSLTNSVAQIHKKNPNKIKVIWPTALIGNIPNVDKLKEIAAKYNSYLFADLCETSLGYYNGENILSCFDMATTSFFWAHEINSIECGMLFTKIGSDRFEEKINNAEMIRSHGLSRVLHNIDEKQRLEKENPFIDPEFLFIKEGTNLRPTDLNATFGLLDSERIYKYCLHRRKIWRYFVKNLPEKFLPLNPDIIPFSLPLIFKDINTEDFPLIKLKQRLKEVGFESRPIISFVANSPAYKHLAKGKTFPNSRFLSLTGCYVGLNNNLRIKDVDKLLNILNNV
ncbi:MAG: aminotransferase class I/II-fold pyridoxal phosphate-dependent enzyme [Sulfurimonas sp.]